jgi:hypothetical protein
MFEEHSYTIDAKAASADIFTTLKLHEVSAGFSSEWWVTRISGLGCAVVGHYEFPVWGMEYSGAHRRATLLSTQVLNFAQETSGGLAKLYSSSSDASDHAYYHLQRAATFLTTDDPDISAIELTAKLYEFSREFPTKTPVQLIQRAMSVEKTKTVYDRLGAAREKGLIPLAGQRTSW